ncbi:MAG: adenine phosphoribosyltransferase [Endomicrobia bacterium]|nr:adenine phosphoribosyltransferase [Endomicrobiia bacterium]
MKIEELKQFIRDIPDFPQKGVIFKDITPLLKHYEAFRTVVDSITQYLIPKNIQKIVSIESRGFILGSAVAYNLSCGFVPVRKKGKLPYETIAVEYELEYGKDILEIHKDAIAKDERVVIIDDVLATGGTAKAVATLTEKSGGKVICMCFLIELTFLNPRQKIGNYEIFSLIKY